MPSDFSEAGKCFETNIPVPEMAIASIRNRSCVQNARHRTNVIAFAIAAIVVLGSGTVFAATYGGGVRLWLSGNRAAMVTRSFTTIFAPKADDLRRLAATATFPVVFPAGLPQGMHLGMLFISPADHPNFIYLQYRHGNALSFWNISLFDSSRVNAGEIPLMSNGKKQSFKPVSHWTVGAETVIVEDRAFMSRLPEIKDAMLRLTPAQSLAQTLPLLHRITVLGGYAHIANTADAMAPAEGRSVLFGPENLGQVAVLAREHKAFFAMRTHTVDNLPYVNGKPDFSHQSGHSTEGVAVSPGGVRALAAVLATKACGGGGSAFTCELLINERSGRAYWIWAFPVKSSTPPAKYIVDSATFRVSQGR